MKSDRCGAWAEQCRFRMGWITNAERKQLVVQGTLRPGHKDGEKCGCCAHALDTGVSVKCVKGSFATRINCYCNEFEAKK